MAFLHERQWQSYGTAVRQMRLIRRTSLRESSMGALRCRIKPLLGFLFLLISCQLFLALLHLKEADSKIGDLMDLPVMNNRKVYPTSYQKNLKNGLEMQRDLNQVQEEDGLHSQNGRSDEHRHDNAVVVRDNTLNEKERTKVQSIREMEPESKNTPKVKYLLPVLLGNQGPNNQLQAVKLVSIIAKKRNLTLVLAPFFDHGPTLETQLPHTFEETLDPDVLSKFVPLATFEEFKRQCNRTADVAFLGSNMAPNQDLSRTNQLNNFIGQTIKVYYNWTQIKIPSTFLIKNQSDDIIQIHADLPYYTLAVDDYLDAYPDTLTTSHQCNAFLYPYGYVGRLNYGEHISLYNKYFMRTKEVRETAKNFIKTAMKNMTYVCIHWRFNEEWKSLWCKKGHGQDLCNSLEELTPSRLASNISHFMARSGIKATYFASELDDQNDIIKGIRMGVPNIYTTSDLIDQSPKLSRDNNYLTSLVEQELCKESTFFFSSRFSSWSVMVKEDRDYKKWSEVYDLFK